MQMERAEQAPFTLPRHIGWFTAGCVLVSNVATDDDFADLAGISRGFCPAYPCPLDRRDSSFPG